MSQPLMQGELIATLEDFITSLADDHQICQWCEDLEWHQQDDELHHDECKIGKAEALIAEAKAQPQIIYYVDDETIQYQWDEGAMEDRPDLHWDKLTPEVRETIRERLGDALCNSSIPDIVVEIVFDVGYSHLGVNTE